MYPDFYIDFPKRSGMLPFYLNKRKQLSIPQHRHDFIELSLVASGTGVETINGVPHRMTPGTMILLLPYQVHSIESDPGNPLTLFICNFSISLFSSQEAEMGLGQVLHSHDRFSSYVEVPSDRKSSIFCLFEDTWNEYNADHPLQLLLLKARLIEMLVHFQRYRLGTAPGVSGRSRRSQTFWDIIAYIYSHYLEPLTLTSLAARFHLHKTYISELFVTHYGIHFVEFLHELRLRHACSLLRSTDMPIAEVAAESGFTSYVSFARIFRRNMNVTPGAFRNGVAEVV